ncbi:AIPR family protein [Humidisolicoccus flavus]|uniref:AIPR family protein n=1 Tax=Humidisolicoccus flavus TaxID=3111414 RepID=UPI00324A11E3
MKTSGLEYHGLKQRIASIEKETGLGESAAFLVWFLEQVYHLEETAARDAVCDSQNDKGIDGIYVDTNNEEIHFLQSKIRQQANGKIGDVEPKLLLGSIQQFDTEAKVNSVLEGNANQDLKNLLIAQKIAGLVDKGYALKAVYVSNALHNIDSEQIAAITESLTIYDRDAIAARIIDIDTAKAKKSTFTFDTTYVPPLAMTAGKGSATDNMYVFPARALQLVHMDGIEDGSLFEDNVRYALPNSGVNREIGQSVANKQEHADFALFHNGIIILCDAIDDTVDGSLTVHGYRVVNGAQSLTQFHRNKAKLTEDLRVLVRAIAVDDDKLAKKITANSNNQNAVRPRDSRSNHRIQVTLQADVDQRRPEFFYDIKRGAKVPEGRTPISNDITGRALLAFDLLEPWSSHQVYKVFDDKYADIFGRLEVTADRIVFVHQLTEAVAALVATMKNRPMASYTLTKYFALYVLSRILRENEGSKPYVADPAALTGTQVEAFMAKCESVLTTVIVELEYHARVEDFDYKTVLKSPNAAKELADTMLVGYAKDVAMGRADSFDGWEPRPDAE